MKLVLPFLFSLILLSVSVSAQEIDLKGKVTDKTSNSPIQGVNIFLLKNKDTIYVTSSDNLGLFTVPNNYTNIFTSLQFRSKHFDDIQISKKLFIKKSYLIELSPSIRMLKEVVVKATRRYRDTTKIDLSNKNFEKSQMIDDLFSEDFGFSKGNDGQLYYKGKPVSDVQVNGGTFFGKNNMDVYHLLPAMVLNSIEIVETNIDSTTNTTTLRPTVTVNLRLKEKYKKGIFGNINLGGGTSKRYLANANVYTYRNNEQINVTLNSNNLDIDQDFLLASTVSFSANGNNQTNNSLKFTYRNVYAKKVEINFAVKGNIGDKNYLATSAIQYQNANQFSSTTNYSKANFWGLKNVNLNINYRIDSLNTLLFVQTFNYSKTRETDSLNYKILADSNTTLSKLNKYQLSNYSVLTNKVQYQKRFKEKKGRVLDITFEYDDKDHQVNENDNVFNSSDQLFQKYYIDGTRSATEDVGSIDFDFIEPLGENDFVKFFSDYSRDNINYKSNLNSDTINYANIPVKLSNDFFQAGLNFQNTLKKISFDESAVAILDERNILQTTDDNKTAFFNINLNFKADYKLDTKKTLQFDLLADTHYPDINQFTNINSTFDILSQTSGNLYLKPELVKTAKVNYEFRKSDTETLMFSGTINHYSSKFGFDINSEVGGGQTQFLDNIGSATSGNLTFSLLKTLDSRIFNFSSSVGYLEDPTILNNIRILNSGINLNESASTSLAITKFFSTSPIVAFGFIKSYYANSSINVTTITYSDKASFNFKDLQVNLYPLFNYNHGIGATSSWSANGEVKKEVFKKTGFIWLQAYDIFNSFKFVNNYLGANYVESTKYSDVRRYLILGLSLKLNNIK